MQKKNFFKHRLKTLYPKIDEEGIKTAIGFLTTQKLVNCPCTVHTEERGYEWIIFRRQPDRKIGSTEDDNGDNSITNSISDDDVFFSAGAEEALLGPMADDPATTPDSERDLEKKNSSTDVSDGYKVKAKPQMSNQPHDSSLHSRDERDETLHINPPDRPGEEKEEEEEEEEEKQN